MSVKKIGFFLLLQPIKFICTVFSFFRRTDKNRKIIVIFWLSDPWGIILSGRLAIKAMRKMNPDFKLILVCSQKDTKFFNFTEIKNSLGFNDEDEIVDVFGFLKHILNKFYISIVPSATRFSISDHLLAGITISNIKSGLSNNTGESNPYGYIFNKKMEFGKVNGNEVHLVEYLYKLFHLSGLKIESLYHEIKFIDFPTDSRFLKSKYKFDPQKKLVGIYNDADRLTKKWDDEKVVELVKELSKSCAIEFYFVGNKENELLKEMLSENNLPYIFIFNHERIELLQIFMMTDLLISTNSNIMHLAGITKIPQLSLFGEYNPFKWAPIGKNKEFIKKSDFVNAIDHSDVISKVKIMLDI